MCYRR